MSEFSQSPDLQDTIDASAIDTSLWPKLEFHNYADHQIKLEMAHPFTQDEIGRAITALQSTSLQPDGSLLSLTEGEGRTFHFRALGEDNTDLTRIDWIGSNGETFAIAYQFDGRLRQLSERSPEKAAAELGRRLHHTLTVGTVTDFPLRTQIHALALRALIMGESVFNLPYVEACPWTGLLSYHVSANEVVESHAYSTAPHAFPKVREDELAGPFAHQSILLEPAQAEGQIDMYWSRRFPKAADKAKLRGEANAVLAEAGLPLIPKESIHT